jgi:hypothetical protein
MREMTNPSGLPSISVVIPIGGNRTNDSDRLIRCVNSIFSQDYRGEFEVVLVVDSGNEAVRKLEFLRPVSFVEFVRPSDFVGRDAIARRKLGWERAKGQVLAATGTLIEWERSNASIAVEIMRTRGVEAVEGIVRRSPRDKSFIGLFRDEALITEFPAYRRDFLLTPDTMAESSRLPSMVTFFMTRGFFDRVKGSLPVSSNSDWDDFCIATAMVEAGGTVYCTNRVVGYLLHGSTLRVHKQFASGVSAMGYCLDYPGKYATKRLVQTILAATAFMLVCWSAAALIALDGLVGVGLCLFALVTGFVVAGVVNLIRAQDSRAFFFPPLTFIQVFVWTCGALYASITDNPDQNFLAVFRRKR